MLKDTNIFDLNTSEEYFKQVINDTLIESKGTPKKTSAKSPKR